MPLVFGYKSWLYILVQTMYTKRVSGYDESGSGYCENDEVDTSRTTLQLRIDESGDYEKVSGDSERKIQV